MAAKRLHGLWVIVLAVLLAGCATGQLTGLSPGGNGPRPAYTSTDDSATSQLERDGVLITPPVLRPGEGLPKAPTGGLIAYSLKAAQARLLTSGSAGDWRRRDPELFTLAGITRPEGVVVDRASGDVILIGHAEEGDAPLTLDDFVVALRARWLEGKWPVVSIDPVPGKLPREGDPQTVRFEGGIQNTQFGADLLDADHSLKRMAFGVLPIGVPGLASEFERFLDRSRSGVTVQAESVLVRYWFEPVQDRVIVRDGVVQLGPMTVSVFTEVLSASVGGSKVDPKSYHDEDSDAFARDISNRFDDVARAHPAVARVRGLNGIVAVVAGLERIDDMPSLDYWLHQYAVRPLKTPPTVGVIGRTEHGRNGSTVLTLSVQGGVELQAIALAVQSGDVSALRRAVLTARPESTAVSWRFIIAQWLIPLSPGSLPPSAVGPLYAQAAFLARQDRWDDVIAVLNAVLCTAPNNIAGLENQRAARQPNGNSGLSSGNCSPTAQPGHEMGTDVSAAFNNRGVAYFGKGQYDNAISDLDQAIRLNPKNAEAFNNRGNVYDEKGRHDRAIQDLDEAIRLNPDYAGAFYNRGNVYEGESQHDRAIQDYDHAIRLAPNLAKAFNNRGSAYDKKGEHDRAIQDYDQAIQLAPNVAAAFNNRGNAYTKKRQYDRAVQDFDQAIRLSPNDAVIFNNRGGAYSEKGQYDRAIQDFDQAIRLNPNYAVAYLDRGHDYDHKGQHDRAIENYEQATRLDPNLAKEATKILDYQRCSGHDTDVVIASCTAVIQVGQETQQKLARVFNNRGNAYNEKGQYDRAIQDYDQAIRLNRNFAEPVGNRGVAYHFKGQDDLAIKDYDQAIRIDPDYAPAFLNRGVVYSGKGQLDRALHDFDEAIRLNPSFVKAFTLRGLLYKIKGQYDRAIQDFDQAARLEPNNAGAFFGRGLVYISKGQYARAIQDFDQAIRFDPNLAEAFYGRGLALRTLGQQPQAAADFAKARQLNRYLPQP